MDLSFNESFEDLYDETSVKTILLDLQSRLEDREAAQKWARDLRFITPSAGFEIQEPVDEDDDGIDDPCACSYWTTFEDRQQDGVLQVTSKFEFPDCNHYAAVSWVWQSDRPLRAAVGSPSQYSIATPRGQRICEVPHHVLSRAVSFADHYAIPFVWFDKECINQDDSADKELGIQSMDIVYQRSLYPLGILQTYIDKQAHLDLFTQLVEGDSIPADNLPTLLEILRMLNCDRWFSRAWILQESTSGGFDMTLMIQVDPSLQSPEYLGTIDGEIETTISEFFAAIHFAYACVSLCDERLDPEFESDILATIESILSYMPTVIDRPKQGFDNPDYRQTCNAAQALTYLKPRQNHRVADRLAIFGNLCNYGKRFDTDKLEEVGYSFPICAFALAIFNGDLSLTRSDNPTDTASLGYSWGPARQLRLDKLKHFEDDNLAVRTEPAKLIDTGLLTNGWLWKVIHDLELDLDCKSTDGRPDPSLLIWTLLKSLVKQRHYFLAQVVWDFTRKHQFGGVKDQLRDSPMVPTNLEHVLDYKTGKLTFFDDKWIRDQNDFRAFFEETEPATHDPRSIDFQQHERFWGYKRWFLTMMKSGRVPLSVIDASSLPDSEGGQTCHTPSAIFDVPALSQRSSTFQSAESRLSTTYIFQPASILDANLAKSQRRSGPIFWVVKLLRDHDVQTGCRKIESTGQMCRGYYGIPHGAQPEMFVFT